MWDQGVSGLGARVGGVRVVKLGLRGRSWGQENEV